MIMFPVALMLPKVNLQDLKALILDLKIEKKQFNFQCNRNYQSQQQLIGDKIH